MTTLLVTLAAEVAAVAVVVSLLLAWGFSGGDDVQPNPVAPLLGIAALVGAVGTLVTTVTLLRPPWALALGLLGVGAAVGSVLWLTAHPEDAPRRRLAVVLALAAVAVPLVFAAVAEARTPTRTSMLWASVPPLAMLLGAPFVPSARSSRDERRDLLVAFAPLVGVPLLQLGAWLLR